MHTILFGLPTMENLSLPARKRSLNQMNLIGREVKQLVKK